MDNPLSGDGGGGVDLFSKIGPLPAWAWAAGVVGAYIVWSHHNGGGAAAVDNPTVSEADNLDYGSLGSDSSGYSGGDTGFQVPSSGYLDPLTGEPLDPTANPFTSNAQWGVYVINGEIKQGSPAGVTTTAITYYLSGKAVTQEEATIIGKAIQDFGSPPNPLPINVISGPTPPTKDQPFKGKPAAPVLTVSSPGGPHYTLHWTKPNGAVRFIMYRDGAPIKTTTATEDQRNTGGKDKHAWKVTAIASNGRVSDPSNVVKA